MDAGIVQIVEVHTHSKARVNRVCVAHKYMMDGAAIYRQTLFPDV